MPAGYSANISQSRVVNTATLTAGRDLASSISSSNKIFHTSPCRQADLTEIRDTNFFYERSVLYVKNKNYYRIF